MTDIERTIPVGVEDEMKRSYIDYAMSVIIGRALPDIRDGMKPVHRRILYAMYEAGNTYRSSYKKSARIVGDVMGKYHPHGDAAIYDTLVRMAQDFSLRYPFVDGQGNFGSVDGDPPAAMRYTEVRLNRFAEELIQDIKKETVDFQANYDESLQEPIVLPAKTPALLINGSQGIAVGMATNIPPHNLGEVVDAIIATIEKPEISTKELAHIVKGPDFPTGGYIYGDEGIFQALQTGRGSITIRGRVFIEQIKQGREAIIITEIPYQVNKNSLLLQIAEIVKQRKVDGITDLRDESDRRGMRVVVELRRGVNAAIILNNLYKHTSLEKRFGIIMLAIVNNRPQVMGLKGFIQAFIDHRLEIVTRRTLHDLRKAEARLHILEGLKIAVENIDEIVELIKKSKDVDTARSKLMKSFKLSEIQAQAILDMRLQRLTGLERDKIKQEHKEVKQLIQKLKNILLDDRLKMSIITRELLEVKDKYNDPRRTEIISKTQDLSIEDFIEEEDMVITVTKNGYIKRTPLSVFRKQHRGGKGVKGMTTRDGDFLKDVFVASTHTYILIFTERGKLYWLKVYDIPELGSTGKGQAIVNLLHLDSGDAFSTAVAVKDFPEDQYVVSVTRNGIIKKTSLSEYSNPRSVGIIASNVDQDDKLISVGISDGSSEILLGSRHGKVLRFSENHIRPMGRAARGVKGITLKGDDYLVDMSILHEESSKTQSLFTITEKGFGKKTRLSQYTPHGRGGQGLINLAITGRNGPVSVLMLVDDSVEFLIITAAGKAIRMKASQVRNSGRATQGVKLIGLGADDNVVGAAKVSNSI